MNVAIAILNFNGMKWLPGLLASISESDAADCPIFVIDNASSDESVAYIQREWPRVNVIRNDNNLGYSAAYNAALPALFARCPWVCLMNTDTLVSKSWLKPVLEALVRNPEIGIAGPGFAEWDGEKASPFLLARAPGAARELGNRDALPVDVDWVEGSIMFVNKQCYEQVGGLNEIFFMYWEDADLCRTARLMNWRVVIIPGSVCRHFEGGSSQAEHPLKLRNHFVYVLINPASGILRNLLVMLQLLATYSKKSFAERERSLGVLSKQILSVVANWRLIIAARRHSRCRLRT